jgi:hypothetical protein
MSKKMDAVMGPRPMTDDALPAEKIKLEGLALDDMVRRPLNWFKHNPENEVFTALKTTSYWQTLERDIREAKAILSPLIAMPDGLLIEGESRLTVARKLSEEGLLDFDFLPVRIIKGELSSAEQRKRLYLGNLSRFEIDENTRAALFAQIWPDLTQEGRPGRPSNENTDTVSVKRVHAVQELAKQAGISERQAWREAEVIKEGAEIAKSEGEASPHPEHIRKAREKRNALRRARGKTVRGTVTLTLPRDHVKVLLRVLKRMKPPLPEQNAIIKRLNQAIGPRPTK